MIRHSRNASILLAVLALLILVQCGKDSPTRPQPVSLVPARITITPDAPALIETGQSTRLSAAVMDQHDVVITDLKVVWSSSNSVVARVNAEGVVTARKSGHARITASSGNVVASVNVSVIPATATIVVTPTLVRLSNIGQTQQLSAGFRDGNHQIVSGGSVSWSSSDPRLATVSPSGVVTAHGRGTVQITATSGSLSTSIGVSIMTSDSDNDALIALVRLYNSTNGSEWKSKAHWLSQAPLGAWYGVTADEDGRITGLDLSDNNLSGSLPSSLSKLKDLTTIDISNNTGLTGPLPQSLTRLSIESLLMGGTDLCASAETGFQNWLQGITDTNGISACTSVNPDREVLVTFYNATNGLNWTDNTNWLSSEPLNEWYGVSTDANQRVVSLDLFENNLLGTLPIELGQLESLEKLHLSFNGGLSGPIPRELGDLENLRRLDLLYCNISGSIPPELGRLTNLEFLNLSNNSTTLTGPLPSELGQLTKLRDLSLGGNGFTGSIPREIGQLAELVNLRLARNTLSGSIPKELGQLTNLKWLELYENELTGQIPGDIGRMTSLETLDLSLNQLTASVPPELGNMAALKVLVLAGNTELAGPLPSELSRLNLETLLLGNTGICAPRDTVFQSWIRTVQNKRIKQCTIQATATAYLSQATQSLDNPVPLVAGEDALLRVFIKSEEEIDVNMPPVRAMFFQGGIAVYTADIPGDAHFVPDTFDENMLIATANTVVPGSVVMPGLEAVIEIDPGETLVSSIGIGGRIPKTGTIAFDVRQLPTLDLTLVPYLWVDGPELSVLSAIEGLTPESDLMRPTHDLLPIGDFRLTIHSPVWTSVDPISDSVPVMGPELEAIYAIEGERGYYMGIFRAQGPSGLLGIAQGVPSYLSLSVLDPFTIAHELGHNLNLNHAPCGGAGGPDRYFPYGDGSIGVSGFDFTGGDLVSPETADLMSYCHPQWISDYSFTRALIHRMAEGARFATPPMSAASRGLLLWGGMDRAGELSLEPAFVVDATPVLPREDGPYTLTGEREDGSVLFTLSFAISEYVDAEGGSFAFIIPAREDWSGILVRITLSGPEGFDSVDTESDQHYAIMRDSATGEVRGILRDWPDPNNPSLAGRRIPPEPGLEIVTSGGIPAPESW